MAEHATFHEPIDLLSQAIMERHRAIVSLMEELEAVDWYDQRVEATTDDGIRSVMAHNRDEEKEHAAMTLEWLRRNDAKWDEVLRTYLFTELPIVEVEHEAEHDDDGSGLSADGSLGIGDLRREPPR
jgi:ferritin-like protein